MAQINKPNLYFNTVLTTGDGTSSQAVTTGFQPDLVWWKNRGGTQNHRVQNSITGTGNALYTSLAQGEDTGVTSYLQSFDSNGFTMGTDFTSSNNFVSWSWKAGGTASSNTDGSITSTVSANTTSGFSIATWTGNGTAGATIGHSLGSVPKMILVKRRDTANDWLVYHTTLTATDYLNLNDSGGTASATAVWNNTEPTSSVFTVGTGSGVNASGGTFVGYCFAEKKGFSKFGSYTGNGSTNGTFVYTGFKPAFVLLKNTTGDNWTMLDNKRNTYNPESARLLANLNFAEASSATLDFLSNGFKCLRTDAGENGSGITYIYMAFAENPLVGTNNIPATAR